MTQSNNKAPPATLVFDDASRVHLATNSNYVVVPSGSVPADLRQRAVSPANRSARRGSNSNSNSPSAPTSPAVFLSPNSPAAHSSNGTNSGGARSPLTPFTQQQQLRDQKASFADRSPDDSCKQHPLETRSAGESMAQPAPPSSVAALSVVDRGTATSWRVEAAVARVSAGLLPPDPEVYKRKVEEAEATARRNARPADARRRSIVGSRGSSSDDDGGSSNNSARRGTAAQQKSAARIEARRIGGTIVGPTGVYKKLEILGSGQFGACAVVEWHAIDEDSERPQQSPPFSTVSLMSASRTKIRRPGISKELHCRRVFIAKTSFGFVSEEEQQQQQQQQQQQDQDGSTPIKSTAGGDNDDDEDDAENGTNAQQQQQQQPQRHKLYSQEQLCLAIQRQERNIARVAQAEASAVAEEEAAAEVAAAASAAIVAGVNPDHSLVAPISPLVYNAQRGSLSEKLGVSPAESPAQSQQMPSELRSSSRQQQQQQRRRSISPTSSGRGSSDNSNNSSSMNSSRSSSNASTISTSSRRQDDDEFRSGDTSSNNGGKRNSNKKRRRRPHAEMILARHLDYDPHNLECEARVLSNLAHPNIVGYADYFVFNGMRHLILEYCDGHTLRHEISERQMMRVAPFSAEAVARRMAQLLLGLEYLHRHGVIHRDLKADNIIYTRRSVLKIADFGFAHQSNLTGNAQRDEMDTLKVATPDNAAPELLQKKTYLYDSKTDIYSAGVVCFELLTLALPFCAQSIQELRDLHAEARAKKPLTMQNVELPPGMDPRLLALTLRMLEMDPAKRPSAKELLQAPVMREALRSFVDYFGSVSAMSPSQYDRDLHSVLVQHVELLAEHGSPNVSSQQSASKQRLERRMQVERSLRQQSGSAATALGAFLQSSRKGTTTQGSSSKGGASRGGGSADESFRSGGAFSSSALGGSVNRSHDDSDGGGGLVVVSGATRSSTSSNISPSASQTAPLAPLKDFMATPNAVVQGSPPHRTNVYSPPTKK